jgi:hypothetical protein
MGKVLVSSVNYNGQNANIVFYSINSPNIATNLGLQTLPYTRDHEDVYGTYILTFPTFKNKKCIISIDDPNQTELQLFNRNSWVNTIPSPYSGYLEVAANRWNKYVSYNTAARSAIANLAPGWNGLALKYGAFNLYNSSTSYVIASCGPWDYVDLQTSGPGVQFNSVTFQLNINSYYSSVFSDHDWINILTHELGHALGIGIYWSSSLSAYGAVPPSNFFLDGSSYTNCGVAYDSITSDISPRNKIPLEDIGGSGTSSAHWENNYRNSLYTGSGGYDYPGLSNELMIGTYGPGQTSILSKVSTQVLVDFGYVARLSEGEGIPSLVYSSQVVPQHHMHLNCQLPTDLHKLGSIVL